MKTNPIVLTFSAGCMVLALLLALAIFSEDPLEARYQECIRQACQGYSHIQDEAQAVEAFAYLQAAKEKLHRCRSLKAQLCRISAGPVAGLGTEPEHCRRAYGQLRQDITELLDSFEQHLLFPKAGQNATL